jgi:NAD(P)-dependent dehydrogenase (short-subunit alcohol dehydrogenase family)
VVGLHLRAVMLLTQAFLPTLRACGQGRIVNMSSRAALGKVDRIVYSATKAGMIGMTRTLAMELGRDGITVNAIGPGPIATELFRKSNPEGAPQTQRILDSIAVGRMGTAEDVARAAMFFLSPDNGFVTGQVLYVCGGTTLGTTPI